MTLRNKVARGSFLVLAGQIISYGCSLVRNMILARLLTKGDFGACAALGMMLGLFELTGKMGISRLVVQDSEGDSPQFLASIHAVQVAIGLLSGIIMAAGAPFLAKLFKFERPLWLLMILGFVALLDGIQHMDVKRYERNLSFGPSTAVEAISQLLVTAAAWPLAMWIPDFRVFLVIMVVKSAISCLVTHLLAERPYRLGWDKEVIRRAVAFGWPLLLTGFLIFGIFQGDQFIVATFYSLEDLAPYGAAASLVMVPGFIMGNVFSSVGLPLMSRVKEEKSLFQYRYRIFMGLFVLTTTLTTGVMIIGAEGIMKLVYGPKYIGSGVLLAWLAASNAFRNLRMAPSLAALSRADSKNPLFSNIGRSVALFPALAMALSGKPIWTIAACGLVGEFFAGWVSFRRLEKRDGIPFKENIRWAGVLLLIVAGSGMGFFVFGQAWSILESIFAGILGSLMAGLVIIFSMQELRTQVFSILLRILSEREIMGRLKGVLGWGHPGKP